MEYVRGTEKRQGQGDVTAAACKTRAGDVKLGKVGIPESEAWCWTRRRLGPSGPTLAPPVWPDPQNHIHECSRARLATPQAELHEPLGRQFTTTSPQCRAKFFDTSRNRCLEKKTLCSKSEKHKECIWPTTSPTLTPKPRGRGVERGRGDGRGFRDNRRIPLRHFHA